MTIRNLLLSLLIPVLLTACTPAVTPDTVSPTPRPASDTPIPLPTATRTQVPDPPPIPVDLQPSDFAITPTLQIPDSSAVYFGFTYQQADGNRYVEGSSQLRGVTPIDIRLDGIPRWVVAAPMEGNGSLWVVVLEDGTVQAFLVQSGLVSKIDLSPAQLPPGMPPLLMVNAGVPRLVTVQREDVSPLTHPVVIASNPGHVAYIATNGDLVLLRGQAETRFQVNALPDARILQDELGRLLVISDATSKYEHAVLGDKFEGASLTLVDTTYPETARTIPMPGNKVIEGIAPIWVDLDDDGIREIIVTLADATEGALIAVLDETGRVLGLGPAAGRGYRWRHQLAVAPFFANNLLQVADNLTPHIGGITEFYSWDGISLQVDTSAEGYSSHKIGSRNLDRVLAGDFNYDGTPELLIPNEEGTQIGMFTALGGTAAVQWTFPLEHPFTTNIAGIRFNDGSIGFGAGLANKLLRLWLP